MSHNFQEVIDELHRGRDLLTSTSGTQGKLDDLSAVLSNVHSRLSAYCSDAAQDAAENLATAQGFISNITRGCIAAYNNANDELITRIQGQSTVANIVTRAIGTLAVRQYDTEVTILKAWVTEQKERWRTSVIDPTTNSVYGLTAGNLATDKRTNHILYGPLKDIQHKERPEIIEGHLYPGISGKNAFPKEWTAQKIMKVTSQIVVNPSTNWEPTVPTDATLEKARIQHKHIRTRWKAKFMVDEVEVNVIIEPSGEGIITSHPTDDYKYK